jgi:FtsH-binding integral membrane protein
MARYLPGIILAAFGILAYAIGCLLYLAYRREKDPARKSKPLMVYGIAMIVLGVAAMGGGLYSLELTQYHAVGQ